MKKLLVVLTVALLLFTLIGCGSTNKPETTIDLDGLQQKLEGANLFTDTLSSVSESVLSKVMYLTTDNLESNQVFLGTGCTGEEYGVFKCTSSDAATELVKELNARVESQKAILADYAPDAIPRLNNAIIKQSGSYVVYVVADKNADALKIVEEFVK